MPRKLKSGAKSAAGGLKVLLLTPLALGNLAGTGLNILIGKFIGIFHDEYGQKYQSNARQNRKKAYTKTPGKRFKRRKK